MSLPGMPPGRAGPEQAGQRPADAAHTSEAAARALAPDDTSREAPPSDDAARDERTPDETTRDAPDTAEAQAELDEFLARAVDRQVTEQRALREALEELSEAVRALQDKDVDVDVDAISDRQIAEQRALREALEELSESVRALESKDIDADAIADRVYKSVRRESESVIAEVRDLREAVLESSGEAADPTPVARALAKDFDVLHGSISRTAVDVEGIAQALIDLNAGLRDWAHGVDRNIGSLTEAVADVRELAVQSHELHADVIEELRGQAQRATADETTGAEPSAQTVADRAEIEQRLKESEELSLYLADQIEDFDRSLARIGDLPMQLEGVVSQALKRTLTAKAKLDKDAEASLADTLAALEDNVGRMDEAVARLASSGSSLRETGRDAPAVAKPAKRRKTKAVKRSGSTASKKSAAGRKRRSSKRGTAQAPPGDAADDN